MAQLRKKKIKNDPNDFSLIAPAQIFFHGPFDEFTVSLSETFQLKMQTVINIFS